MTKRRLSAIIGLLIFMCTISTGLVVHAAEHGFYDTFRCVPDDPRFTNLYEDYDEVYVCVRGRK